MNRNLYIYVINRKTPSVTHKNKWDTYEEVSIKSRIIPSLYDSATFVVDVMEMKLDKNRYEHSGTEYTFDNVMSYLSKNHEVVRNIYTEVKTITDAVNKMEENAKNLINNEEAVDVKTEQ